MPSSPRFSTLAIFAASLITLSSCSEGKKEESAAQGNPAPAASAPKFTQLSDVPLGDREALEAFCKDFEAALRAQDHGKVQAAFNASGMVDRFLVGVSIPASKVAEFRKGMETGLNRSIKTLAEMWGKDEVKYKHLVIHEGLLKGRFRFSSDSGISIMDLLVIPGSSGKLGIVDAYNHAVGAGIIDQTRQTALPALAELDRGFLERMFGSSSRNSMAHLEKISVLSKHFQRGEHKRVVEVYRTLPQEMQDQLMLTVLYLNSLAQLGDDKAYGDGLRQAARVHKSPSFQFMLVDLYVLENDHARVVESLDAFMAAVEKDALLLALKAMMQKNLGDIAAAKATLKEAFALEPDSVATHQSGIEVLLAAKDHAAVAASLRLVESKTEMRFKGGLTDPMWADFLQSPESEPWR